METLPTNQINTRSLTLWWFSHGNLKTKVTSHLGNNSLQRRVDVEHKCTPQISCKNDKDIVGDFNTTHSPMDRSSKMKINQETQALNDTLNKMDLIDIYRTFHPKTTDYTFFSSAHGTFSRIDHIWGHKSSLSKFKKIETVSSIFCKNNAMRLDINYWKKSVKNTST